MESERQRVLNLLAQGKLTVTEAERLLDNIGSAGPSLELHAKKSPQFLRVTITPHQTGAREVNVRIPLLIIKTGIKLGALMPGKTQDQMQQAFRERGLSFDLNQLDSDSIDRLSESLSQAAIEVDDEKGFIRIFCE